MEEQLLIRRAIRGDADAFAALYEVIYKDLYKFALYTLKHPEDAEDVVSDTVMDAWAGIKNLRKEESFKSWMFKILSNKCRQKLKSYLDKTAQLQEEIPAPVSDTDTNLDVRIAFQMLGDEDRLILSLNLFAGYTSAEIGKILNLNDNTVRSRQKRALEKMADYMKGKGGNK